MLKALAHVLALLAALAVFSAGSAAAAPDQFTGVWVGNDPDGSVFRIMLGAPGADGTRSFTAFDLYATFCETSGAGSGSSLSAQGTATTVGSSLSATITSFHCANGSPGAIPAPFPFSGTLLADGTLDVGIILAHPGGA
jgi:hypothetical protein